MKNLKKHNSINIYNYNAVNVIDAKITLEEFDKYVFLFLCLHFVPVAKN